MRRLSLRARLLLVVVLLAVLGLAAADIATYTSLRSFLVSRTDATLRNEHQAFEPGTEEGHGPPGVYSEVRAADGRTVLVPLRVSPLPGQATPPAPLLPQTIRVPAHRNEGFDRVSYFTAGSRRGGEQYRVRAAIEGDGSMLIIATPLNDVNSTLHRLFFVELLVTLAVLAALAVLGLWIVRRALQPLSEIERTAAQITAGDLSHRVDEADESTEVGR